MWNLCVYLLALSLCANPALFRLEDSDVTWLYGPLQAVDSTNATVRTDEHLEITGHRGLARDVAWAPGNIRGYDLIATAGQDGYARVYRLETPDSGSEGGSWSIANLHKPVTENGDNNESAVAKGGPLEKHSHHSSNLSASLAKFWANGDRVLAGQPGQAKHTYKEISRLDNDRTPIWRVGFDDDGQILGITGDDGHLICYRQTPDGSWAKSSELAMMKTRMVAP
jgi:nucleoporin SEH1